MFLKLLDAGTYFPTVTTGVGFLGVVCSDVLAQVGNMLTAIRAQLVPEVGVGCPSERGIN